MPAEPPARPGYRHPALSRPSGLRLDASLASAFRTPDSETRNCRAICDAARTAFIFPGVKWTAAASTCSPMVASPLSSSQKVARFARASKRGCAMGAVGLVAELGTAREIADHGTRPKAHPIWAPTPRKPLSSRRRAR
jgi:hypothetical protein